MVIEKRTKAIRGGLLHIWVFPSGGEAPLFKFLHSDHVMHNHASPYIKTFKQLIINIVYMYLQVLNRCIVTFRG